MKNSINPHRLYKNPQQGIITGVCAGIADYFDLPKALIRFLVIVAFLFTSGIVTIIYIVLAFLLEKRPPQLFHSLEEETFWRGVANAPRMTLSELKYKFMTLNERMKKMEDHVTSPEFELEEKYKNL